MKTRNLLSIAVLALALFSAAGPAVAQERVDLIILLDSSRSMLRYYNQVVDYVVSDSIRKYLRFGDGFHLLNFAETPQLEIAQVLRTEEDVRTVLSRLYLMYPLGRNTDLINALRGVSQYVSGLSSSSAKYIILITDGMHSPAPDSQYAAYTQEEVRNEMGRSAARIRERGWTMRIVQVPFNGGVSQGSELEGIQVAGKPADASEVQIGSSKTYGQTSTQPTGSGSLSTGTEEYEVLSTAPGTGDYLGDIATALGTSIAVFDPENAGSTIAGMVDILRFTFPQHIKARSRNFKIKISVANPSNRPIPIELQGLRLPDGTNILTAKTVAVIGAGQTLQLEPSLKLPESYPEGLTTLVVEPRLGDNVRVDPPQGSFTLDLKISAIASFVKHSTSLLTFLLILIAVLCGLILVLRYIRSVHRRAEEPVLQAFMGSSEAKDESKAPRTLSQGLPVIQEVRGNAGTESVLPAYNARDHYKRTTAGQPSSRPGESATPRVIHIQAGSGASSSSIRTGDSRTSMLDQWATGNLTRYSLPLKSTLTQAEGVHIETTAAYAYQPKVTKPGTLRVELIVRNQNQNIGSRNIKTLHAGRSKTIGGKTSDFLVFLLPVPKRIADVHYDGQVLTIVPVKPVCFPDYAGPIEIGFGEEIRFVNSRGKELFMRFERYIPPLERLNKLLHCIEVPGLRSQASS